MVCTEKVENSRLVITDGSATLSIPIANGSWGSPDITLDGQKIPAGRIWTAIAYHTAKEKKIPRPVLMAEAKRAALYRQEAADMLVYTIKPRKGDKHITGNVYSRAEKQRTRPMLERFGIRVAKIEAPVDVGSVRQMHEAAESLGLYPVAAGDDRVMYAPDPEAVFTAFGSRDWVRIYVYLKRPGSTCVPFTLSAL